MTRSVLVTGGARGIGRAIVEAFAPDHRVAFTYHEGGEAAAEVLEMYPDMVAIAADFSDGAAVDAVARTVAERFGSLDVLVNNAASVSTGTTALAPSDMSAMNALNVEAPMALTRAVLPLMGQGGVVLTITSGNATRPPAVAGGYAATKAALEAWSKAAAIELGPRGIRVNCVAPGPIERDYKPRSDDLRDRILTRTPLGHLAGPEVVAPVVRFLASDDARFVTGAVVPVDGGFGLT